MRPLSVRAIVFLTSPLTGPVAIRDQLEGVHAIVVLGCPLTASGAVSRAGIERVETAAALYRDKVSSVVVFTGRGEANAMARLGTKLGIAANDIVIEECSRTTAENAEQTARILGLADEDGPANARVVLVSQPFHLRRARFLFRRSGFDALAVCAPQSIQWENPRLALRWSIRELAAWFKAGWENRPGFGRSGPSR